MDAPAGASVDGVAPRFIARPADAHEVSRLLALAHAEGLAVIPRGAGVAAGLGNPPLRADIVLDLTRLHRVLEYEPADVTVSVEAGIALEDLGRVLAKHRQTLPLDPPGFRGRTVGGVLATNASGPLRARYGTARDMLLGVRFVQADGTITWGGSRVVKSVTGYDVPKLMVGALGTLGVIVEATLRLHPMPETERTWLVSLDSLAGARDLLAALFDSALQPARVEIIDAGGLAALHESAAAIGVAISIASVDEAVRAQGERVTELAAAAGGAARPVDDDFWDRYDAALAHTPGAIIALRITCLASDVTDVVAAVASVAAGLGLDARVSGCAGHGVLRAVLGGECSVDVWHSRVVTPLRERLGGDGGTVVVEQAAPAVKAGIDVWGPIDPRAFAAMQRLKAEFDPTGVLNPGRFVGRL